MAARKSAGKKGGREKPNEKVIATNRRARHDYEVLDTVEAGLSLLGPEVKSLREGRANMGDSFAVIKGGEAWLEKLHITPYEYANRTAPEPMRERKLLLHKHEIHKLHSRVVERGLTLVPLKLYLRDGRVKVELGLVRGKHQHDKRETIKRRDADLEARRAMRRGGGRERS
jgi:SsrA-binding protein